MYLTPAIQTPLSELHQVIQNLETWPAGWNGHDVAAPKEESIRAAHDWVDALYSDLTGASLPWETPHVSADENGDVALQWWKKHSSVTVYISPDGAEYVRNTNANILEMEDGSANASSERIELWKWLVSQSA